MNRFTPASWRADLKGRFSAATVALPLGLAFGSVVLDLSEVSHIDDSKAFAFENIIRKAQNNDQHVILVGLHRPVIRVLVRTGLLPLISQCVRFRRRLDELNYARKIASN